MGIHSSKYRPANDEKTGQISGMAGENTKTTDYNLHVSGLQPNNKMAGNIFLHLKHRVIRLFPV
jgi:hypothetical protein